MSILFILFIIIILALVILLVAPIRLSISLAKKGTSIQGFYKIGWLGITIYKGDISQPTHDAIIADLDKEGEDRYPAETAKDAGGLYRKAEGKKKKHPPLKSPNPKDIMEALPALMRVFKDLVKSINLVRISCCASFGFDDPADTAIIYGYILSAVNAIGSIRSNISIEPHFEGEKLEGSLLADIRARLLWIALAFVKALGEEKIRKLLIETARRGA